MPHLNWYEYVDPKQEVDRYSQGRPRRLCVPSPSSVRRVSGLYRLIPSLGPDVSWGGFERKYFMAVVIPQDPSLDQHRYGPKDSNNMVSG